MSTEIDETTVNTDCSVDGSCRLCCARNGTSVNAFVCDERIRDGDTYGRSKGEREREKVKVKVKVKV